MLEESNCIVLILLFYVSRTCVIRFFFIIIFSGSTRWWVHYHFCSVKANSYIIQLFFVSLKKSLASRVLIISYNPKHPTFFLCIVVLLHLRLTTSICFCKPNYHSFYYCNADNILLPSHTRIKVYTLPSKY